MIIKIVALGNQSEAFIEDRLLNKTNIIFSNDNNKGKTILMQSILYSIGYDSIWPANFDAKKYYFYTKIEINEIDYEFLRHKHSIQVYGDEKYFNFNSISEFKYFMSKGILNIPKISKDGRTKVSDLSLLYEIFFLGQDKRNTSNIIVRNNNNKTDFLNMIFSSKNITPILESETLINIDELKVEKNKLVNEIKLNRQKIKILKKDPQIASYVSNLADTEESVILKYKLEALHNSITDYRKQRNREENRKLKLVNLLFELKSLNQNLKQGNVKCADCNSTNIIFENSSFEFDVSNAHIKNTIIASINENIKLKEEIIDEISNHIIKEQNQINKILNSDVPDLSAYILFSKEIRDSNEIDNYITKLNIELN